MNIQIPLQDEAEADILQLVLVEDYKFKSRNLSSFKLGSRDVTRASFMGEADGVTVLLHIDKTTYQNTSNYSLNVEIDSKSNLISIVANWIKSALGLINISFS